MKRITSILLVLILLITTIPTSVFAIIPGEDSYTNPKYKTAQRLYELYGENGILDDDKNYTWDCNAVTAFEITDDSLISPLWSSNNGETTFGVHGEIIDEANYLTDYPIPEAYLPLVKEICRLCDSEWNAAETNELAIKGVHGLGNYVVTLKFLWKLALKLSKQDTITVDIIKDKCQKVYDTLYSKLDEGTPAQEELTQLKQRTQVVLCYRFNKDKTEGQTKEGRCIHILYGMLMHYFGDLYAHRLILPQKGISALLSDSVEVNAKKMLNPLHFLEKDIEIIIEKVKDNSFSFGNINDYPGATFTDGTETTTVTKKTLNKKYTDNPQFYPKRVDESIFAATYFLDYFNDGYDVLCILPWDFDLQKYDIYYNNSI